MEEELRQEINKPTLHHGIHPLFHNKEMKNNVEPVYQ